jgi:hypothetical protein
VAAFNNVKRDQTEAWKTDWITPVDAGSTYPGCPSEFSLCRTRNSSLRHVRGRYEVADMLRIMNCLRCYVHDFVGGRTDTEMTGSL